jgi:hypothetical protein
MITDHMAARSKAYVCGRLVAGIAGSNPARGMYVCLLCLYVVLSCVGRGLCDGLITRPEESYSVSNCVCNHRNPERGPMFQLGSTGKLMNEKDDCWMMNFKGCGRKQSSTSLWYYPRSCLERLRKTTKILRQDSESAGRIWTRDLHNAKKCFNHWSASLFEFEIKFRNCKRLAHTLKDSLRRKSVSRKFPIFILLIF